MLDLMKGGSTEPAGEYTYIYGKGNENHELELSFVHKGIISTVRWLSLLVMSYIILIGCWFRIIVKNVMSQQAKIYDVRDSTDFVWRFNLKKLNVIQGKEQYHVEVSDLQLLNVWTLRWKVIVLGKQDISKFQLKREEVIMN
jgi:hypothetical protein